MGLLGSGKLSPQLLVNLMGALPSGPRVVLWPKLGEDAAVIDMGGRYFVAKTDPITFATDEIGWYSVRINANDIAVMGATPSLFLATILLPSGETTTDLARIIFEQIGQACRSMGIAVIGGHTEITHAVNHPVVVGCMLGEVDSGKLVLTSGV